MTILQLRARYYRLYPANAPLGHTAVALAIDSNRTALLLVDVYGTAEATEADPGGVASCQVALNEMIIRDRIRPARDRADRLGIPVVYCENRLSDVAESQAELRRLMKRTWAIDIQSAWQSPSELLKYDAQIAPRPGDHVIAKEHTSAFFNTPLDSVLRALGVSTLVMAGFDARVCLATTAMDALARNYQVIVLRDATRTVEYPDTASPGWAILTAIRLIESEIGFTATSEDWRAADVFEGGQEEVVAVRG